jgi:hypothetical protein
MTGTTRFGGIAPITRARGRWWALVAAAVVASGLGVPGAAAVAPDPAYDLADSWGLDDGALFYGNGIDIADGIAYVADTDGHVVVRDLRTGTVTRWGTPGSGAGQLGRLADIAVHDGRVYVADSGNRVVHVFTTAGVHVSDLGAGDVGVGQPRAVDVAPDGTVYVAGDWRTVYKFPVDGPREVFLGSSCGTPKPGDVCDPYGIEVTADGTVYIADRTWDVVQSFTADGEYRATYGTAEPVPFFTGGSKGLAVDAQGRVFTVGNREDTIEVYSPTGKLETTITSDTTHPWTPGLPGAIALDDDGRVYLVNAGGNLFPGEVLVFEPTRTAWEPPVLTGTATLGGVLTSTTGVWPTGARNFTRQWLRDGTPIPGAAGTQYTLTTADVGHQVSVAVEAGFGSLGTGRATSAPVTVTKAASALSVSFTDATVRAGVRPQVRVTVSAPAGVAPTGTVKLVRGSTVLSTVTLTAAQGGKVTVTIPAQLVGRHTITARYSGDSSLLSASKSATLTVSKALAKVTATPVDSSVTASERASVRITVTAAGLTGPTGELRVYDGWKRVATATLLGWHQGKRTVTLPRLAPGKHTIRVVYSGSSQIAKASATTTITVTR